MPISVSKNGIRTKRVTSLFEAIPILASNLEEKEKGDSPENCLNANEMPRTGLPTVILSFYEGLTQSPSRTFGAGGVLHHSLSKASYSLYQSLY